ncbi:MAG: phosphoadenosine phosphosulfate reductase [Pseudomonadota bacterium]
MTESGFNPDDHRRRLADYTGPDGWVRDVGPDHLSIHRPGGAILLVEFTEMGALHVRADGHPWASGLAREAGYATLTIAARGATWFRDDTLHDHFDRLTDDGFFDAYETVIFTGGGMGAYGAAAHSLAAPGAVLFLVQPYATLDRAVTPWEDRFRAARRLPFGRRYGNAARMAEAAACVFVVTDPTRPLDAMHASLFSGDHVTRLPVPHAGPDIWRHLIDLDILDRAVAAAAETGLTRAQFARLWRARRDDPSWLTRVLRVLDDLDRPWLTAIWAGAMLRHRDDPRARRRLNAALAALEAEGRDPPGDLLPTPADRLMLLAGE